MWISFDPLGPNLLKYLWLHDFIAVNCLFSSTQHYTYRADWDKYMYCTALAMSSVRHLLLPSYLNSCFDGVSDSSVDKVLGWHMIALVFKYWWRSPDGGAEKELTSIVLIWTGAQIFGDCKGYNSIASKIQSENISSSLLLCHRKMKGDIIKLIGGEILPFI